MTARLNSNLTIRTLALDLGLDARTDPVPKIVKFCRNRVSRILSETECTQDADGILCLAAAKLDIEFIEVHSPADAVRLQQEYVRSGETGLAMVSKEFESGVLGITVRRLQKKSYERRYLSLINCCGRNFARRYFTKWHEIVHLLTLTDQTRLSFRRTHVACELKDPEESLVDVVAGRLAFHPMLVKPYSKRVLSFELVDEIRAAVFPEASRLAAMIVITEGWPHPAILTRASLAANRVDPHTRQLRATEVNVNDAAAEGGVSAMRNFRVPTDSVIQNVFAGHAVQAEGVEELERWVSSDGSRWRGGKFVVRAARTGDGVQALLSRK